MLEPLFFVVFIFVAVLISWVALPAVIFVFAIPVALLRAFFGEQTYKNNVVTQYRRIFNERFTRKKLCEYAVVAALISGAGIFIGHGPPRFWRDFTGMNEAEVREQLGPPIRDSRDSEDNNARKYTLGWSQGPLTLFVLTFEDEVVVSQNRYVK